MSKSTNNRKVLIETNENDYMTYYEEAARSLSELMKNWNLEWDEKKIKDSFIALTESYYLIIRGKRIDPGQVEQMYDDLEVYFGQDAENFFKPYKGNASEVRINWSNW